MIYQGEQVNFSQDVISNNQLLSALQATNRQVATNSDNLVDVGTSINQINEDHKNMPKGGNGFNPFGDLIPSLSLTTVALGGLAAYFLLRKK